MATVEVTFTPLPAHVRTARLIATAVARRSGVDESLLDEVRLAVGEACSRAVEAHRVHCPQQPIKVALTGDKERFEVVVTDAAPPAEPVPVEGGEPASDTVIDDIDGLVLIAGLADDVRIGSAGPGTSIAMSWKQRVASGG
jgi:anti-sigma regulatory factor (Ser/Thr protein kinase)